jgi:glycine cleavage system H protein
LAAGGFLYDPVGSGPKNGFFSHEVRIKPSYGEKGQNPRRLTMQNVSSDASPGDRRYSAEHVWIRVDGAERVCGITFFAQEQLGEVVYVGLPEVGARFAAGEAFGTVESMKSTSELFMPISGEVVAVNTMLEDTPDMVNTDPYAAGWMLRVRPENAMDAKEMDHLLTDEEYRSLLTSLLVSLGKQD